MDHRFDTLAKAMATGTTRRQALKWLSGIMGGMLVGSPLTANADNSALTKDCNRYCHNTLLLRGAALNTCINACVQCGGKDSNRLCGPQNNMVCCSTPCCNGTCCASGQTCANGICCSSGQTNCNGTCCSTTCCNGTTCCASGETCVSNVCTAPHNRVNCICQNGDRKSKCVAFDCISDSTQAQAVCNTACASSGGALGAAGCGIGDCSGTNQVDCVCNDPFVPFPICVAFDCISDPTQARAACDTVCASHGGTMNSTCHLNGCAA
jgi:hypothetical protein